MGVPQLLILIINLLLLCLLEPLSEWLQDVMATAADQPTLTNTGVR